MSPKTRLAEKNNKEDALEKKKNESMAKKKKVAAEKKKKDSARKKKETSVKRRREAVKKKRDAAKKKTETETAKKKRKRNSVVDGGSSLNPTKRARNTASPPEQKHQGDHSPAPSAELPSQADVEGTPGPTHPSEPQKSPTQAPSEAENPLQPPVTSLSISESATNCPSHRVDNHDEEIVSNNRDSHTPEAAIDHTAQRTESEDMATISRILPPIEREQQVIYQTMDEGCWEDMELLDDGDDDDAIVDVWNKFIVQERGQIFWEDICKEDIKSRSLEIEQLEGDQLEEEEHEAGNEPPMIVGGEAVADLESLKETVMSLMSQMTTMEGNVNNKLEGFDRRLKMLEGDSIGREGFENMDFQYNEDGGTSGQQEKDGAEDDGKEPEKELEVQPEKEATDDAENDGKEAQKELEVQPEKEATDDGEEYTLRVMEAAAEKVEAEAADKVEAEAARKRSNGEAKEGVEAFTLAEVSFC
ncbi:hypothetical protein HID58_070747 [Brassica napus]|uniref:Uncharacterized protein n=1 Tax=Brassica napus TaxID=3708 RepID=A0ABQ7YZP9_BRANA|nr:hypothetical protein HID58_070747 [Brassica napus]